MAQDKYIVLDFIKRLIQLVTQFVYRVILKRSNQIEPPSVLKTETIKYYETAKTKLLNTYNSDTYNADENIDVLFYDKTQYASEMEIHNNEQERIWKRRVLMDSTPRGNLIMYYDPYKLGFAYYSDTYLPYHILNAAAMKYVVMYRCRDFFVDELIIPETHPSKIGKMYFVEKDAKKESHNSANTAANTVANSSVNSSANSSVNSAVFAQLKNYNKPSGRVSTETSKTTDSKTEVKPEKIKNVFVNLGKIANYSIIQKTPKTFATNGFRTGLLPDVKISWSDYKKMKTNTEPKSIPTPVKETIQSEPVKTKTKYEIPKDVDDSTLFLPDDDSDTHTHI